MSTSMLELDEILRRYAWNVLKKKTNFIRRFFLDEADYVCEVDWSCLSIEHKLAKFVPREKDGKTIETNFGDVVTGTKWVPLWSCDFENKADLKQVHSFRGARDTTTWVDVDIAQGYTVDKEMSVDVNIPPTFSRFRAGRDNCLKLNKVKGQVFKEVMTWEVNSTVEIQSGWKAHAQLFAKQECTPMEFEIRSTLFNPKGILPVYFKRKSDRRVIFVVELEDFNEAFKLETDGGVLTPEEKVGVEVMVQKSWDADGEETSESFPQMVTKGTCVCLSWSDQKIDIKTFPMSNTELNADGGTAFKNINNISEKQIMVKAK